MSQSPARTLGELKRSGYCPRSVKYEMRSNLIRKLEHGDRLFPGILGYEDTVVPQLVNAVLARHNFILLGLRGQAKSRILRQLVDLLDERIPIIAGSEVNDDPFHPISKYGRLRVEEMGDETPIDWVPREQRYVEKLATPDVTIADIIGDVDPIRAARGGHVLSDELTIHYGLLPRANRGIFAVNELPDLAGKIQVGLFNIMQEGDVQIKGYPIRLALDVQLVFTANPEDYTARGKIITPLKDRVGAEIMTHYPEDLEHGVAITAQEAWTDRGGRPIRVPRMIRELVERIAFEARGDQRIDRRSGVSQRLPITVLESVASNAERRAIANGEDVVVPWVADVYAALPAITGKLELEYEGEREGGAKIARDLISRAAGATFDEYFDEDDAVPIIEYFDQGGALQVADLTGTEACLKGYGSVPGLVELARTALSEDSDEGEASGLVVASEIVLEGLVAKRKISRSVTGGYTRRKERPRPPHSHGLGGGNWPHEI
ncbi:MAG: magnesium chelatase [Gemmatimonadota bacterium]|nr:MAG: magnesium chelatase [Gemmatimonadota bacterium]